MSGRAKQSWRLRQRAAAIVACLAASSCDLVDPYLAPGAEPFTPPPVYARWWSMVESCSGITRSINTVDFYVVGDTKEIPLGNGDQVSAYWSPAGNLIVLAEDYRLNGAVVRHEMLHAILRQTGHPRKAFIGQCAGVTTCGPGCLSDAGPATVSPGGATRVQPNHIVVEIEVTPEVPRASVDDGLFSITVLARNPSQHAVFVEWPAATFSLSLQRSGSAGGFLGGAPTYLESFLFAPGETKRNVYDFRMNPPSPSYPQGDYLMRGGYGDVWTEFRPLKLAP